MWFKLSSPRSSRADTARTRRRYIRPALAPAPLRERAGRLARDTVVPVVDIAVVTSGRRRRQLCGAAPSVKPAARPGPAGTARIDR